MSDRSKPTVHYLVAEDLVVGQKTPRKRKPTLSKAMMERAKVVGMDVTIAPDGSIMFKKSDNSEAQELSRNGASDNPWDEVLKHGPH